MVDQLAIVQAITLPSMVNRITVTSLNSSDVLTHYLYFRITTPVLWKYTRQICVEVMFRFVVAWSYRTKQETMIEIKYLPDINMPYENGTVISKAVHRRFHQHWNDWTVLKGDIELTTDHFRVSVYFCVNQGNK